MIFRSVTGAALLGVCAAWSGAALAQAPADLNPAVNTSDASAAVSAAAPKALPAAASATAAAAPVAAAASASAADVEPASSPQGAPTDQPPPTDRSRRGRGSAAAPAAAPAAAGSTDRIELGTTQISGNRELPKLMYIVPWQRAEVGKLTGRPPNSLVDEALS